jgi:hypothetical protein
MLQITLLVLVLAVGSLFIVFGGRRADRKRQARFIDREEMSFDEFYRQYYEHSGLGADSVRRALFEVATALQVSPTRLRPADRFNIELAPEKGWEVDDGAGLLAHVLRNKGVIASGRQIRTLDDFVRAAASMP